MMPKNKFHILFNIFLAAALVLALSGFVAPSQALTLPFSRQIEIFEENFPDHDQVTAPVNLSSTFSSSRKIVVFEEGFTAKDSVLAKVNALKLKHLNLVNASAVELSPLAEKILSKQPGVLRIEDDLIVEALSHNSSSQAAQVLPWGIDRIDAEKVWGTTTADVVKVAIIDTGIELAHPDLKANIKGGYNAIRPSRSANDDNGHGTHVAGTVAALNNTIGVVGVGPKIDLYAVKVLAANGSGWLSDIIEGLDWAVANKMKVINMSLGTSSFSQSFADAVKRVYDAGIVVVAAAGNSGSADNTVLYPAKFPESIAVSATNSSDALASFSSRGPEVDLAAPGVSIFSTYKGKTYATLSGTSMAAPHVAGVAALVLAVGNCGGCSPAEVQAKLEATAEDFGAPGKDNLYGSGLVDALAAVTP